MFYCLIIETMRRLFILLLVVSMVTVSCSDKKEMMDVKETTLATSDCEYIAALIFSIEDTQKTMVLRSCSGEILVKVTSDDIGDNSVIKTRSESGAAWIRYGEICTVVAAKKATEEIGKKYGGKCYEMRIEPTENGCKILYHRAC